MNVQPDTLKNIFAALKRDLGDGFVAADLWTAADGTPLVENHEYNRDPKAIVLLDEATKLLYERLKESEYPGLGNYYLLNLENNYLAVVLTINKFRQFVLVDLSRIPMGVVMSVAIPKLINNLAELEAIKQDMEDIENSVEEEIPESPPDGTSFDTYAGDEPVKSSSVSEDTDHTMEEEETSESTQIKKSSIKELFNAFTKSVFYFDEEEE